MGSPLGCAARFSFTPRDSSDLWLPSSAEMQALDVATISGGIPALKLMERAGEAVTNYLIGSFWGSQRIVVVCGSGNNGGDGMVIARLLRSASFAVTVVACAASRYSAEWVDQIKKVGEVFLFNPEGIEQSQPIKTITPAEVSKELKSATVIVDAMLGTGQRAAPKGSIAHMIELIGKERTSRTRVVSVDIPTGVHADSGELFTPHVTADQTICIELIKRGLTQYPAHEVCGDIRVVPIGIGRAHRTEFNLIDEIDLPHLPAPHAATHKGNRGRVLVVAGSQGMPGAADLSALGAMRSGAGLVTKIWRPSWPTVRTHAEVMLHVLEGESSTLVPADVDNLQPMLESAGAVIVGPGLGWSSDLDEALAKLLSRLSNLQKPTVLDASAITSIARQKLTWDPFPVVITPHPGEAAVLLGISTAEIQRDRFAAAEVIANRLKVTTLLKGAGTIVYSAGRGWVLNRGTPYMATAGSGDVLCGIIATLLGQDLEPASAAVLGAYIHACAGEQASLANGGPILASDICGKLPAEVGRLHCGKPNTSHS